MFSTGSYDPETIGVMARAFDEAWITVRDMLGKTTLDPTAMRSTMAKRIMAAADDGERDPERLKLIALWVIAG